MPINPKISVGFDKKELLSPKEIRMYQKAIKDFRAGKNIIILEELNMLFDTDEEYDSYIKERGLLNYYET